MTELAGEQSRRPEVVWQGFACYHNYPDSTWERDKMEAPKPREPKEAWRLDPKDPNYAISDRGRRRFLPPQVGCG